MKTENNQKYNIFVGDSQEVAHLRDQISRLASSQENILLFGEPGTEKTEIARLIIDKSDRKDESKLFLEARFFNSLFPQKVEELTKKHNSNFPLKGTLVLDSIGNLNKESQNILSTTIKSGLVKVPHSQNLVQTNFRIISIENIEMSYDDIFIDKELLLNLSTLSIKIPSFKERKQDVPAIFSYMLKKMSEEKNMDPPAISIGVYKEILQYDWPGNYKELENVTKNIFTQLSAGEEISVHHLPFCKSVRPFTKIEIQNLNIAVAKLEDELVRKALQRFAGNQSDAARALSISETNLRYKMKKLGIRRREYRGGIS